MENSKKNYILFLLSSNGRDLDADSNEFDIALSEYGIWHIDNWYYRDFLNYIK